MAAAETHSGTSDSDGGGSVYAEYITEQVTREEARKESIERRGLAVVTSAGALVTLLFGLAAFNIGNRHFTLPHSAKVLLIVALSAFFISALCAIATNFPFKYDEAKPDELYAAVKNRWADGTPEAERMTSYTRLKVWRSARTKNNLKATYLYWAIIAQGVAVAAVAAAVGLIL
jgi:hypothetical protein